MPSSKNKCPLCKIDRCWAELKKHQSSTALRSFGLAWRQFQVMLDGSAATTAKVVIAIAAGCGKDHYQQFGRWYTTMSGNVRQMAKHGIVLRRKRR